MYLYRPSLVFFTLSGTFTPRKNRSSVWSAARGSVSRARWLCTRSSTWRSRRTSVRCAAEASTSGPIWRRTCWRTQTSNRTIVRRVAKCSAGTVIYAGTASRTTCHPCPPRSSWRTPRPPNCRQPPRTVATTTRPRTTVTADLIFENGKKSEPLPTTAASLIAVLSF